MAPNHTVVVAVALAVIAASGVRLPTPTDKLCVDEEAHAMMMDGALLLFGAAASLRDAFDSANDESIPLRDGDQVDMDRGWASLATAVRVMEAASALCSGA